MERKARYRKSAAGFASTRFAPGLPCAPPSGGARRFTPLQGRIIAFGCCQYARPFTTFTSEGRSSSHFRLRSTCRFDLVTPRFVEIEIYLWLYMRSGFDVRREVSG